MYFSKAIIDTCEATAKAAEAKRDSFAVAYGGSTTKTRIMSKFPKTGKFMAVYKMKDVGHASVGWSDKKVIPHEADQFAWIDGELFEYNQSSRWIETDLDSEVDFLADEAIESSLVFLTMGQPDVYVEKTVLELRG